MNKRIFLNLLMAVLLLGLSQSVISCKDDDDEKNEQRSDDADMLDTKEAQVAWQWLCALTDAESLTTNWASKTYEPTIGEPSENNELNRLVIVGSIDEARQHFGSLADIDPDKLVSEQTINVPGVGKLVWTPSGADAQNLAEVSVDTKLIPNLQKIVYCTPEQKGVNGIFWTNVDGTAYYRLGDIIRDADGYYWVCVRPSFKQGDKEKSYWFNIYNASESGQVDGVKKPILPANIYDKYNKKPKYNNQTIILPTGLKYEREHIHNLSNLIWALLNPDAYATLVGTSSDLTKNGLCGFDYKYHGKNFLNAVSNYWRTDVSTGYDLWQVLFHTSYEELHKQLVERKCPINLIYNGYSWIAGNWGNLWRYQTKGYEVKMKGSKSDDEWGRNFGEDGFDVRADAGDPEANEAMKDSYTWVVRMKTGSDLTVKGKYSPYEQIKGCTDIYRYNERTNAKLHSDPVEDTAINQPTDKTAASNAIEGSGIYMLGDVLEDEEGSKWICIAGNGQSPMYPNFNDTRAAFISFDNIKIQNGVATNIIKDDDLMDLAIRLGAFESTLTGSADISGLKLTPDDLGAIGQHILTYASVDLRNLFLNRDSIWHFQNYNTKQFYDSKSTSNFTNLAYNNGSNRQAIARFICDVTQAGEHRLSCYMKNGKRLELWQYRLYKRYEVFNPEKMAGPNENEASVGMTKWQSPWAISSDEMHLDDVASQDMVDKYAAADKWVRLTTTGANGIKIVGAPRKKAETSAKPEDYIMKRGHFATSKTSIFNEPVLFLRLMYVEDKVVKGNDKTPNLVSTEGRKLKIVHLQNNHNYYIQYFPSYWARTVWSNCQPGSVSYWLDNERFNAAAYWPKPTE